VRYLTHYTRKEIKVKIILVIESGNNHLVLDIDENTQYPCCWIHVSQESCDQFLFGDYIDSILEDLGTNPVPNGYDDKKYFVQDNLSLHKKPYITHLIRDCPTPNSYPGNMLANCPKISLFKYFFAS